MGSQIKSKFIVSEPNLLQRIAGVYWQVQATTYWNRFLGVEAFPEQQLCGLQGVQPAAGQKSSRGGGGGGGRPMEKLYKKLWKRWAARKAVITTWKTVKEKLATSDKLERRGINLNNEAKSCKMCKEMEENVRHLFFECKVSYQIWCNILNWLGVSLVPHNNTVIHFLLFGECLGRGTKVRVAATIWIGTVWSLWNLRNEVVFNRTPINIERRLPS
ncbi:hypothetical protein ACS0TY_016681 [Phlomoides rotata]